MVELRCGEMIRVTAKWKTMHNEGVHATAVYFDGQFVTMGDEDEIDPPQR